MSEPKDSTWESILWQILILVCVAAFIAWVSIPNYVGNHRSPANACINNLRQIDAAKSQWALENGKSNGTLCTEADITPYIKLNAAGHIPGCPSGGIYTIGKVGEPPTCSLGTTVTPAHVLPP